MAKKPPPAAAGKPKKPPKDAERFLQIKNDNEKGSAAEADWPNPSAVHDIGKGG